MREEHGRGVVLSGESGFISEKRLLWPGRRGLRQNSVTGRFPLNDTHFEPGQTILDCIIQGLSTPVNSEPFLT